MPDKIFYNPKIFDTNSIEDANKIILTKEGGWDSDQRWDKETLFLIDLIGDFFQLNSNMTLLDYGCGIGRLSKGLIEKFNCKAVGVDISESMRQKALEYVNSENFRVIAPDELEKFTSSNGFFDVAISIWVLQHCFEPKSDILKIKNSLKVDGKFFVLNNITSAVPTNKGWINNKIDIHTILKNEFEELKTTTLPLDVTNEKIAKNTFISFLQNKDDKVLYFNLGNDFFYKKDFVSARENYFKSLQYDTKNEKAFFNIAMTFIQTQEIEKAKEYFLKAIDLNPKYLNAYINLGIVNKRLELVDEAIFCFEKALDINPNEADIYYNYANIFLKTEQYNTALFFYNKSLELGFKDIYKIHYSLGLVYQNKNEFDKAMNYFNKCLEKKSDYADAHFAKATIDLLKGDFKNGWKEYEYRWDAQNELKRPKYEVNWLQTPEQAKNKRILVQEEQGFGDNIQFIRYIYKLIQLNAEVFLAIRTPLYKLFSNIKGITLVENNQFVENIDYFTSLLDLPRIFYDLQDEFLYKDKYIDFIKEDIFEVKNKSKLNIGFVWRGNPAHKGDKKRNIPIKNFEKLFKLENCDFYSLQYENDEELDEYLTEYKNIYKCKDLIKDFNDTANIVTKLDLVITIDTSMVHLCGVLGVKTFLILGINSEWRWLLDKNDSIWYKSIQIFRQENHNLKEIFKKIIYLIK